MKKVIFAGYYDDRIFKNSDGEDITQEIGLIKNFNVYTLEEALELSFVRSVIEWCEENGEEWEELTEQDKLEKCEKYVEGDEIAFLTVYKTEDEALKQKELFTESIREIEKQIEDGEYIYLGKEQDRCGYFNDVYQQK